MKKNWLVLGVAAALFLGLLGLFVLFLRLMLPKRRGRDFYLPKVNSDFYVPKVGRGFYVPKAPKR